MPLVQFIPCDDLARILQQQSQHPKRLLLEPDFQAVLVQLARTEIHLEHAEPNRFGLA